MKPGPRGHCTVPRSPADIDRTIEHAKASNPSRDGTGRRMIFPDGVFFRHQENLSISSQIGDHSGSLRALSSPMHMSRVKLESLQEH